MPIPENIDEEKLAEGAFGDSYGTLAWKGMDWDALGAIGEIVDATTVVLTLIYLSTQIKLNAKQQRSESQRAVGEEFNRIMSVLYDLEKAGMIFRAYSDWSGSSA